jgi:predicted nucleic acid-binding protein
MPATTHQRVLGSKKALHQASRSDCRLSVFLLLHVFRRIVAYRRTLKTIVAITDNIRALIERTNVTVLQPTARHWPIFFELVRETRASGPLVSDAHLAALAIEHGATLYTNDRDFRRFPKLNVRFPLAN